MESTGTAGSTARARFVLVCQQVLLIAVLMAVAAPALAVKDLDLVPPRSAASGAATPASGVNPSAGR